jgi:hypothetical protein
MSRYMMTPKAVMIGGCDRTPMSNSHRATSIAALTAREP